MTERRKRSSEEFRSAALQHDLRWWSFRRCSLCECPIGFELYPEEVLWCGMCDCTSYGQPERRSWQYIADLYNDQTNETVIADFDAFWRFTPEVVSGEAN